MKSHLRTLCAIVKASSFHRCHLSARRSHAWLLSYLCFTVENCFTALVYIPQPRARGHVPAECHRAVSRSAFNPPLSIEPLIQQNCVEVLQSSGLACDWIMLNSITLTLPLIYNNKLSHCKRRLVGVRRTHHRGASCCPPELSGLSG